MDRSESKLFGSFIPPSPSTSPFLSTSGKPSGLSRPRMVKVRRHLASAPVRAVSDAEPGPAFNPFRRGVKVSENPSGQNPNSDANVFVFGSGVKSDENPSTLSSDAFEPAKSDSVPFVFGASSVANFDAKSIGSQDVRGGSRDSDVFMLGSGVKKSSSLDAGLADKLSDKVWRLNLQDSGDKGSKGEVGGKNVDKNFSWGSSLGVDESSFSNEMMKLNMEASGNEQSKQEVYGNNVFIFGSSVNAAASVDGSTANKNSSCGSSFGNDDEKRKLNFGICGNVDGFDKAKEAYHSSKVDGSNSFIFGSTKSIPGSFGGGIEDDILCKSSTLKPSSSVDYDKAKLSEEVRKLNLHNSGSEDGSKDTRKNTRGSKVDGNNIFVFGSGNGAPCTSIGNSMDNPLEQSSDLGQHSSIGFDEGSSSKLPDELWKLNLQSSGNDNSFGHTKQAGNKVDGNNTFVFGSSKSTTSSFGSTAVNRLPDDMEKLNLGSGAVLQGTKEESTNFAAGVFVFGSNRKSAVSSQTSTASFTSCDKSRASVLPDGLQNFKTTESVNTNSLEKATDNHCNDKVDAGTDCYVSGGISSSLGGSAVSTSPDEIKKLHISNITENLMGSTDQVPPPGGLATNCACNPLNFTFQAGKQDTNVRMGAVPQSPLNFTFQAGKQDTNVRMGAVPQSQSHDFCMSTGIPTGSSLPSMQGSNFETSAADFTFTSIHLKSEAPHMEFKTLKQDASSWFNDNFFSRPHQNMEFGVKKGASKNTRTKKKRGKLRQSAPYQQSFAEHFTSRETGSQENPEPESPGGGSPMDYSPYQETLVADRYSPEASITINESTHLPSCSASTDVQTEDLASATQGSGTKEGDRKQGALKDDVNAHTHGSFTHESSFVSEKDSVLSKKENVGLKNDTTSAAKEAEHDLFSSDIDQQVDESGTSFTFASSIGDIGGSSFAFVAPSVHGRSSQSKRHYRRKDRVKACQALFRPTTDAKIPLASSPFPVAGISAHQDPAQGLTGISSVPSSGSDSRRETNNEPEVKSKSIPTEIACVAAQETCEKWRLRGNQAYASGLLSKAEDYYTRGVNSVSPKETSKSCIHALMLCYSNRAATRMSLGRIREALSDCMMAAAIDPSFLKAQLRAGNCHLALGETQDAMKYFKNCLQLWNGTTIDQKISSEASEGLQKAQKVAGCMDESAALLLKRTSPDARKALEMVSESLSISPHSESLIEMKAEALLVLRSYEEVIQLCQQTLDSSERNFVITGCDGQLKDMDRSEGKEVSSCRLWRWRLISKSYFYLGKLEEALDLLQKHEQVQPLMKKYRSTPPISSAPLLVTIRELLRLKASGNEAFQAGRHMEAVEHYTSALACNTESRPFAAILFCNRAAAYQALGQITDAIADCSLAIALDGSYPKAISRRATLYDMIRDYGQASNDLHRLISLLEKHSEATDNNGLKRAHSRLSAVEEEAKKDIPLDMYMILGIEPSSSAADVKKAYRKAALKHHPDKAGQFITRSENIDDGLWKDIADEVHIDADRLFKMIGEAYTILSDPTKRLQYDAEEEMRTTLKKGYGGISTPRAPKATADSYSSPYDKSSNRHQWHDGWKSYGSSQQRSSEYSRSNRR